MTSVTMTPAVALRLAKVLGMLGSDHDGGIAGEKRWAPALVKGTGPLKMTAIEATVTAIEWRVMAIESTVTAIE